MNELLITIGIYMIGFINADSSTNVITPMMSYAGIILAFMRRYRPDMSLGDMIVMMFPYSACFLLAWTALLLAFFVLGVPFGF